ncbi:pickpocket 27 [Haematobia irritans]|uniref:pickpocket 27 n=1 Tax=Haematobia irritans TaxID=7368 RepID=UPI003F50A9D7
MPSSSSPSSVLYVAAKETLVEYFQKTSLNGFGLLYYIRRRKYQRIFWFMFIVMGVTFATYVCLTTMTSFLAEPTVTALDPQEYTIWDVPFPSIAVCSNNKLSHKAMKKYSENITSGFFDFNLPEYWLKKLKLFAGLFNTDSIDFDEALDLQTQLERSNGHIFNVREVLKGLAPKCEDLLLECYWSGQPLRCKEDLKSVAFANGHCCVFNYLYDKTPEEYYYVNRTGKDMGLVLLLNSSTSDYFYTEDNWNGFNIQIFGNQRIPETSTGEVGQFHVDAGDSIEIRLQLISQFTTKETQDHPVEKRGCYFPNEHKDAKHGLAECLFTCRMQSIKSLCDCVPFYYYDSKSNHTQEIQCSLAHSECLERHRITWQTYSPPPMELNKHLQAELLDSVTCAHCLPLCSYNRYQFFKAKSNLKDVFNSPDNMKFITSIPTYNPDISLVKIYYETPYGTRYQKNVLYNWFAILSNIGGVIGISMGCSLISGFEIIYFGVIRLVENYLKIRAERR